MHFSILLNADGQYSWMLIAANHQVLVRSELYDTKEACVAAVEDFRKTGKVSLHAPIRFHSCFISYSSLDQRFVEHLHAKLEDNSIDSWFAPKNLAIGAKTREKIDETIADRAKLLLVLSRNSVLSQWVEKEVETAFEKERLSGREVILPIRIDDQVFSVTKGWAADLRRSRNIGDFTNWRQAKSFAASFAKLLAALKA